MVLMVIIVPLEATDNAKAISNNAVNHSNLSQRSNQITSTINRELVVDAHGNDEKPQNHWHEVIVKWRVGAMMPEIPGTKLLAKDMEERIAKLAVDEAITVQDIIAFADIYTELEYAQPNYRYKIQAIPNDSEYQEQWHHAKVNLPSAWNTHNSNKNIVIAVLDTGVDLTHPELTPNLVPGYNIIDPNLSVQDDYGHGTQVAGILGAAGNNMKSGTGVLWNTRIMPIKVLDGTGEGDDYSIGQGIRYAVKNGAKIVVLSLGDRLYSRHMDEAVQYAEEQGVLLIAATGNNSSTINYPAAFPTVLAVGASDENDLVPSYSNFGPEIDVVAPAQGIYTTTLRGQMTYNSGTSMAAPIVAGIAGLIYNKYPDMEPWQVRQLLRQSSVDVGEPGWDQYSGYGRVDAYRALNIKPEIDIWKTNNSYQQAKPFPQGTLLDAALTGINDADWFYIDVKHSGKVQVNLQSQYRGLNMTWYRLNSGDADIKISPIIYSSSRTLEAGRYYVRVGVNDWNAVVKSLQQLGIHQSQYNLTPIKYRLDHKFVIAEDKWELNNTIKQAAAVDIYSPIIATFHRDVDHDWYKVDLPYAGELVIEVVNSYGRMDPVLTTSQTFTDDYRKYKVTDDHAQGAGEFWRGDVKAGTFYFMVADYQLKNHPVPYQIKLTYLPKYEDRWEPNGWRQDAPMISRGYDINGFLDGNNDVDWFAFLVEETMKIEFEITEMLPNEMLEGVQLNVKVFESTKELPTYSYVLTNQQQSLFNGNFSPGVYYVQLARTGIENTNNRQVPYKLRLNKLALASDNQAPSNPIKLFTDINNEELKTAVAFLNERDIVYGFPDNTFRPSQSLTRAEIASLLLRAMEVYNLAGNPRVDTQDNMQDVFTDIDSRHWAYPNMQLAVSRGLLIGFDDSTIRPNQPVTRAQLAAMLHRAFDNQMQQQFSLINIDLTLLDVPPEHWAYQDVIVNSTLGLMEVFDGQRFLPNQYASREQVALALYKLLSSNF